MVDEKLRSLQRQIARLSKDAAELAGDTEIPSFREYAMKYLAAKLERKSLRKNTKAAFRNQVIRYLVPKFGDIPIDKITAPIWLYWVSNEKRITRFFNARKVLIEILRSAQEEGLIEKLPKLENPDEARNVGRVLEVSEIAHILFHTRRPFRVIFWVFFKMGCRPREILQWEWGMIRWEEPAKTMIDIPGRITKTGRSRVIPLNSDVSRLLWRRSQRGNGSVFVFPKRNHPDKPQMSYQNAWESACRRAGVEAAQPYDLRRTFITRCAVEGLPMEFVAKQLDSSTKMFESTYIKAQADVMRRIAG